MKQKNFKSGLWIFLLLIVSLLVISCTQETQKKPNGIETKPPLRGSGCKNLCGDGRCEQVVCLAIGCPCPETPENCPQDCSGAISGSGGVSSSNITVEPEDPNKTGMSQIPDYPLNYTPPEPLGVNFLVEHRTALDGKTVRVVGIVESRLLGENACPSRSGENQPAVGMCAKPRITLTDASDFSKHYELEVLMDELMNEQDQDYPYGKAVEIKGIVMGEKTGVVLSKVY